MKELSLQEIYDQQPESDKGTVHSYISHYYNERLEEYRHKAKKVLEIGILYGDSARLWKAYFSKAEIIGIDITPQISQPGITFIEGDAYAQRMLDKFVNEFDIIIDDGPHTLDSQKYVIEHWIKKLKPGGLLVIEDIQSMDDAKELMALSWRLGYEPKLFDLRDVKGRYDDMIIEITKH